MWRALDPALVWRDPGPADAPLALRFLGTAGFVLETPGRTLALDPFVSRPGIWRTLCRRLRPDEDAIARHVPTADDVLVGHAHYDHVLDAPALCRRTGARLIGSRAVCHVGRAAGLPEAQLVETAGREAIACGDVRVRGLPSRHGKVWFGRVPLPGDIEAPPRWPPRLRALRHGLVLNWHLEAAGMRIVHVDSADYIDEELEGLAADVLCLCAIGWTQRPRYVERIVELLSPRWVVPCHWDLFTRPLAAPARLLPGVDLAGFVAAIAASGATPVLLPLLGTWRFGRWAAA